MGLTEEGFRGGGGETPADRPWNKKYIARSQERLPFYTRRNFPFPFMLENPQALVVA